MVHIRGGRSVWADLLPRIVNRVFGGRHGPTHIASAADVSLRHAHNIRTGTKEIGGYKLLDLMVASPELEQQVLAIVRAERERAGGIVQMAPSGGAGDRVAAAEGCPAPGGMAGRAGVALAGPPTHGPVGASAGAGARCGGCDARTAVVARAGQAAPPAVVDDLDEAAVCEGSWVRTEPVKPRGLREPAGGRWGGVDRRGKAS